MERRQITRAEFYEKYGDVIVSFSSYYKYTFVYTADLGEGKSISVSYGGNHDQIYRHEECNDGVQIVRDLQPYAGSIYFDGNEVEGFYDY